MDQALNYAVAAVRRKLTNIGDSVKRLAEEKELQEKSKVYLPKLNNRELLMINAAMPLLYFFSDSLEPLEDNDGDMRQRVTLKFSRPPIPRKLTPRDADFVFTWAAHIARQWNVYIAVVFVDKFGAPYVETAWFSAHIKYKPLQDAIEEQIEQIKSDGNINHFQRALWVATIKDKRTIAQQTVCKRLYGAYNPEKPALEFVEG